MRSSDRFGNTAGIVVCCLMCVVWLCHPVQGAEQVVQNDSIADGSGGSIQAGFEANESAAVWLTSPCNGNIVAIQVLWLSQLGAAGQTIEDKITIFEEGTFPIPLMLL